ncbi:uncharacterized protein UTRI_04029 [Ustilago trichophora]|uniref:Transcription factor TFIIIC triple barrel domain-containing protein n=1 Tax=Ustilago trichophora TaxID=86804 RepID=A0A5C3E8K0_9BASI|nr:uncharacterized protein UTRI_04029 [Ustilago trichophora]
MTVAAPIIDACWHRLPEDNFAAGPSRSTPYDPSSTHSDPVSDSDSHDSASEWSYEDEEQLITLDLGTDRIARRALLGYSGGLDSGDTDQSSLVASGAARTIRGTRTTTNTNSNAAEANSRTNAQTTNAGSNSGSSGGSSAPHLGAGKMLSITGLDTSRPLMKIGDSVLRGSRMDMFGSEIVLCDDFDPTRAKGKQHCLNPIPPSTGTETRANVASSTTRTRLLFRPIYDPTARETAAGQGSSLEALHSLARSANPNHVHTTTAANTTNITNTTSTTTAEDDWGTADAGRLASMANLMGGTLADTTEAQKGIGRGKYKRKEVSAEEQLIRQAERRVRKLAKAHYRQQRDEAQAHEQQQTQQASQEIQETHRQQQRRKDMPEQEVSAEQSPPPPLIQP